MSRFPPMTITAVVLSMSLVACESEPEPREVRETQTVALGSTSTVRPDSWLPQEAIDSLKAEYPVLQKARAPEPTPSPSATPGPVPERVQDALPEPVLEQVTGEATYYADKFEGRRTASGIPFRQNQMVAAHRAYPFGTLLRVTNLRNDRSVNVRVVDRGPFGVAKARGAIIDLSRRAAERLDYIAAGKAPIRVEVLEWGEGIPRTS